MEEAKKWTWSLLRTNATALALVAALFSALTLVNDTNILHNIIVSDDTFTAVLVYLTLGSWVGVIVNFVYNRLLGRVIEETFRKEQFISWRVQRYAMAAGGLAAISTFSYLLVAGEGDPSILIALSNFSIVYLTMYDRIRSKISLVRGILASFLVLLGASLVSVESVGVGFLSITIRTLFLLLVVRSVTDALSRVCEKEIVSECGGVNLAFWRFLWLAVAGTLLAVLVATVKGSLSSFISLLGNTVFRALPWVALTMFLAYGNNTLRIVAQNHGLVSSVAMVHTAQIAMAVPLTLLIAYLSPVGAFTIPNQAGVWLARVLGTIFLIIGIAYCPKR